MKNIDSYFVESVPTKQNIVDVFRGEWSSRFPLSSGLQSSPGHATLFEDARIHWLIEFFGGVKGKSVIELGPLEGAHSYMLHEAGVDKLVAIEKNSRAFLKCLCVKELFQLTRCEFLLGDCLEFLRGPRKFDIAIASGILYHLTNPETLLALLCEKSSGFFLWTHFYDEEVISNRTDRSLFSERYQVGNELTGSKRLYPDAALGWNGFSGGSDSYAVWLDRGSIVRFIETRGFKVTQQFVQLEHQNGPAFALCAIK
jgi:hypothetical protein